MENEEYEIKDLEEYSKQKAEYVKKQGNYARVEIIIPKIENNNEEGTEPIVHTELSKIGVQEVSMLLLTLEETFKVLKNRFPMEYTMGKILYEAKDLGTQEYRKKDEEEK